MQISFFMYISFQLTSGNGGPMPEPMTDYVPGGPPQPETPGHTKPGDYTPDVGNYSEPLHQPAHGDYVPASDPSAV